MKHPRPLPLIFLHRYFNHSLCVPCVNNKHIAFRDFEVLSSCRLCIIFGSKARGTFLVLMIMTHINGYRVFILGFSRKCKLEILCVCVCVCVCVCLVEILGHKGGVFVHWAQLWIDIQSSYDIFASLHCGSWWSLFMEAVKSLWKLSLGLQF